MRTSAQILIYIDVQKALDAGIKFHLSENGVVLTEGNERGFLAPEFFSRVETRQGELLLGHREGTASEAAVLSPETITEEASAT